MSRFLTKFRSGRFGAVFALLAAVLVVVVFAAAALIVRGAIERNASYQQNLRLAQTDRARLLRLQIDEETGMRGYVATKSPVFLQPYRSAAKSFDATAALVSQTLTKIGVSAVPLAREVALNAQWRRSVADPAIATPATGSALAIQLRGKELVDRFRREDAALYRAIDDAAAVSETRTSRLVNALLSGSVLAGIAIAAILSWLGVVQTRLADAYEEQRRAYLEEKRIADALQEAFLQKTLPELPKADLHAVYTPAGLEAKVGGDWYDAFELSDNRILFSIGDVAGHGVEAAVVMSRVRQAVLTIGVEERDPARVLERANEVLLMQDLTMVTAVCGIIDMNRGSITIANAGHPAAVLIRDDGRVEMLGASGPPLGAVDRPRYRTVSTLAEAGSMLVLYTDGLIEYGRNWDRGEEALLQAIRSIDRRGSVDPAAQIMTTIFGGSPPVDDVAILTITFRESTSEPTPVSADLASASARPLLDRSVKPLLESMMPALYARAALAGLEASASEVEYSRKQS